MGMTIDDIIQSLIAMKSVIGVNQLTINKAVDTMRRYQKIEEIVTNNELEWGNASVRANALLEVKKVVEDGNNNQHN